MLANSCSGWACREGLGRRRLHTAGQLRGGRIDAQTKCARPGVAAWVEATPRRQGILQERREIQLPILPEKRWARIRVGAMDRNSGVNVVALDAEAVKVVVRVAVNVECGVAD